MVKVQDIVLEHKKRGVSQIWVFENIIGPMYNISYSTFNRYLSYPAKMELKNGKKSRHAEDRKQLSLF